MNLEQIRKGVGFFTDGGRTLIWQWRDENLFDTTATNERMPGADVDGWHFAGGGCIGPDGGAVIEWVDCR